ncbi:MAG: hypothetical protein Q9199_004257 [Rusavskia elegans]
MRYLLIVLAALSLEYAIAQPAHHRHHHKARRTWEDVDFEHKTDYDFSGVDSTKVDYNAGKNKAAVQKGPKVIDVIPIPAESDKKESDQKESDQKESNQKESDQKEPQQNNGDSKNSDGQSTDTSSGSSDTTSGVTGGAKGSFGGRTPGRAGATEDQYHGNVGVPYGSNMMAISTGDIDKYKYTNTFKNTGSNPLTIQIWNKVGRDGAAQSGMGEEPNMMFTVQPGQSQTVAFDENTTAAFSRKCDRSTQSNIPMCVWGEITFGCEMPAVGDKKASDKWSGFNRSSIPAGANEILTITCTSCDAKAREETKSGKGQNTWETAGDPFHKNGIRPGIAHLLTEMAY